MLLTRSRRFLPVCLLLAVCLAMPPLALASSAPPLPEPSAPAATAPISALLEQATKAKEAGKAAEALAILTKAKEAAQAGNDFVGMAKAWELEAMVQKGANKPDLAISAWKSSAEAWARVGDGPGQALGWGMAAVGLSSTQAEESKTLLQRAVKLVQEESKRPLAAAWALQRIGVAFSNRRELTGAEAVWRVALTVYETLAPNALDMAADLNALGNVASERGDLSAAESYYKQALEIIEKLAPGSLDMAANLINLGSIAEARGDLSVAESYYKQALEIVEKPAPGSLELLAGDLNDLGNVAFDRGDLSASEAYNKRALTIQEKLAPNSLDVTYSLNNLGTVAESRGDLRKAETYHNQSLAMRERLAPGSLDVAASLSNLGAVTLKRHLPNEALTWLNQAVQIVENQRSQIATLEGRSQLLASKSDVYDTLLLTHLALHHTDQALLTVERTRARSLADRLTERQTDFTKDVPAPLLQRQQQLDTKRRIALNARARLDPNAPKDKTAFDQNTHELDALNTEQRLLDADIRKASPRYAALAYPKPPTLSQLQRARKQLKPGDLLLEYAVADEQTTLFAVTASTLNVYTLPLKRKTLTAAVQHFQQIVSAQLDGDTRGEGRQLYDQLLRPAQAEIAKAKRLLLSPDGPLHTLCFAALVEKRPAKPTKNTQLASASERYLVQARPLLVLPSLLLQQALRRTDQPAHHPLTVLALGNPVYPQTVAKEGPVAKDASPAKTVALSALNADRFVRMGGKLDPLPQTENQLALLRSLYGPKAHTYRQQEATAERFLAECGKAQMVHLACHGLLDNSDPLASALKLSPSSGHPDGLLSAYEVFSRCKLNADLVVLGACETGLGGTSQYEGVVGLTRAFAYAGARSLLVSLFEIPVEGETPLMEAFYRGLHAGLGKAEALQAAQVKLLRDPQFKKPVYWAAYQLYGE